MNNTITINQTETETELADPWTTLEQYNAGIYKFNAELLGYVGIDQFEEHEKFLIEQQDKAAKEQEQADEAEAEIWLNRVDSLNLDSNKFGGLVSCCAVLAFAASYLTFLFV